MNSTLKTLGLTAFLALAGTAYSANPSLSYINCPATRISSNGLEYLKKVEDYSPTNYPCRTGHTTIGYGHKIKPGEKFDYMSREEAQVLLLKDIVPVERTIAEYVKVPLNQNEHAALVSLGINIGTGKKGLSGSTLVKKLNAGDKAGAVSEFDKWVYGTDPKTGEKRVIKGLVNRRAKDKALFLAN